MSSKNQRPEKTVYIGPEAFDFSGYSAGSEGIVGTAQVPTTQVWRVPVGMPLVVSLVGRQIATVTSGVNGQTITLDPEAPLVDYLDDPTAGEYTTDASLVGYFDSDGDGNPDTLITDSTQVSYDGNFGTDGDFIDSVDVSESAAGGDVEVAFYKVMRHGVTKLQKRNSGKGNVSQELQAEDSITWAFSNPDAPDTDRQITWDVRNDGLRGVIPPKYKLDLVFYDKDFATAVEQANASNVEVSIPVSQRPVREDEDPEDLRRKIRNNMVA